MAGGKWLRTIAVWVRIPLAAPLSEIYANKGSAKLTGILDAFFLVC